jgi:hypothetical protein
MPDQAALSLVRADTLDRIAEQLVQEVHVQPAHGLTAQDVADVQVGLAMELAERARVERSERAPHPYVSASERALRNPHAG